MHWRGQRSTGADAAPPAGETPGPLRGSIKIVYEVRRSDLVSMYLGSWGARLAAIPGLVCFFVVLAAWPPPADDPIASYLGMLGASVLFTALGPLVFLYFMFGMYGAGRLVGTTVHLSVDDEGVSGWPLAPGLDRTWPTIRRARTLRGVVTLPFRQFGTRAGWVPVPERAMPPAQLSAFLGLLSNRGLIKARKPKL